MKKINSDKLCNSIVIIMAVIRTVLQTYLPTVACGLASVDDMMMVEYADELAQFHWLGEYDGFALNKVPGFSVFLAISDLMGVPYALTIGAFFSLSAICLYCVLNKYIKNRWISMLAYLYVLFCPIMFATPVGQRVYRQSIIPPLVLLVVVSYLAIYQERNNGTKKILPWSIVAAVSYTWFYLTREDSIWFFFFVFGATVLLVAIYLIENKKKVLSKKFAVYVLCLVMPLIVNWIGTNVLCAINYHQYGVYVTNDLTDTNYARMCKLLMKIKPTEEYEKIYVSRDTINRVYDASPTFAMLKGPLEIRLNDPTSIGYCDGEIERGYFAWLIRWTADDMGAYSDAVFADEFYGQICVELEEAFEQGIFEARDALILSGKARPIKGEDVPNILEYSFYCYEHIIGFKGIAVSGYSASGPDENLDMIEDVTNQVLIREDLKFELGGWIFPANEEDELILCVRDAEGGTYVPSFEPSHDVYLRCYKNGIDNARANQSRFNFGLMDDALNLEEAYLDVIINGEVVSSQKISEITLDDSEYYHGYIDQYYFGIADQERIDRINRYQSWFVKIVTAYSWSAIPIAILAFGIYIAECIIELTKKIRKQRYDFALWFIKTGILLTIWADLLLVSVNYYVTERFHAIYVAGTYVLWQIFVVLALVSVVEWMKKAKNKKPEKCVEELCEI